MIKFLVVVGAIVAIGFLLLGPTILIYERKSTLMKLYYFIKVVSGKETDFR